MSTLPMTVMGPLPTQWDPESNKYNCCCNFIHKTTGAKIIGIVEFLFLCFYAYMVFAGGRVACGPLLWLIVSFVGICFLYYGLQQQRAVHLLPHIVIQIITIILLGVVVVYNSCVLRSLAESVKACEIALASSSIGIICELQKHHMHQLVYTLILDVTVMGVEIWFVVVVLGAYKFLRDKRIHSHCTAQPTVIYTVQSAAICSNAAPPATYEAPPPPYAMFEAQNKN